ncbi:MAG: hypothetical protein KDK25_10630 [Leptospiraceae bacterium]|nr:hypothetical protein [Leptospiraceae bacterium]
MRRSIAIAFAGLVLLFIPTISGLHAEAGDMDLEIKLGISSFRNNLDLNDYGCCYSSRIDPREGIGSLVQAFGAQSDYLKSVVLSNSAARPSLYNRQIEAQFDYYLSTNHSLGLSFLHNEIGARNVGYSKIFVAGAWLAIHNAGNPAGLTLQQEMDLEAIFPFYQETVSRFLALSTLNLSYSYHLDAINSWEPYLRLQFGAGRDQRLGYLVYRGALQVGTKYFLSPDFYLSAEAGYDNYSGYEGSYYSWTLDSYSFNLGAGYRL